MPSPQNWKRPTPAVALGLGLLGLLLWGQCAVLFPAIYGTPAAVYIGPTQVDSLVTAGPTTTLYLELVIYNKLKQDVELSDLRGNLTFKRRRWAFSATDKIKGMTLQKGQRQFISVPVPLSAISSDSLALLRTALHQGSVGNSFLFGAQLTYFTRLDPTVAKFASCEPYMPPLPERRK